jgi:hypothetical protein
MCSLTFEAMLYCLILPEENHGNPSAIHGYCAHSHLKQCYTRNPTWGKSRKSQCYTWTMCSLTFEAMLYCLILPEENHENPSAIHGYCAHSHLKQWYTAWFYLRKITRIPVLYMDTVPSHNWSNDILVILSEEYHEIFRAVLCAHCHLKPYPKYLKKVTNIVGGLRWSLVSLAFEESLYY